VEIRFSPSFVCLSVGLSAWCLKNRCRITKRDTEMFHHESWKAIYFGVNRSKAKVMSQQQQCRRGSLHSCECWLLLVNLISCGLITRAVRCGSLLNPDTTLNELIFRSYTMPNAIKDSSTGRPWCYSSISSQPQCLHRASWRVGERI